MTREEAIRHLEAARLMLLGNDNQPISDLYYALDMAIKALEQEPCEDAISREATLKPYNGLNDEDTISVWLIRKNIEQQPPVNLQPKTGHWIIKDGREQGYDIAGVKTWYIQIMCSECGVIETAIEGHTGQYHYCPNCSAKMVEPQESEGTDADSN